MNFKQKVERSLLRRRSKKTARQTFEEITFFLVKKGGFSLNDLMEAPTPFVMSMHDQLIKYYKEKQKQEKKASKKR